MRRRGRAALQGRVEQRLVLGALAPVLGLVVELFRASQLNTNKAGSERESGKDERMFTGTLIEGLMAAVERAEARTQELTPIEIETCSVELLIASVQENPDSEPKLLGVA
jgi:hypothetical protein